MWGCVAILTNITVSLIYVLRNKEELGNLGKNNLILLSLVLSPTVPYIMIYLFFVFILSGFTFSSMF